MLTLVLLELLHHYDISRKPLHTFPLRFLQPTGRLMLIQHQFTLQNATPITMHGKMKIGIVILYGTDMILHGDSYSQFLLYFPTKCFFGCFSLFYLPSWKLPQAFEITISTLGGEDFFILMYDGCYYFDCFHVYMKSKTLI